MEKTKTQANLHHNLDGVLLAVAEELNVSVSGLAVNGYLGSARLLAIGVLNGDVFLFSVLMVFPPALTLQKKLFPALRMKSYPVRFKLPMPKL